MVSVDAKRWSRAFPYRRLRIFTCTNARKFPGVRCCVSITRWGSPLNLMTWPLRISLAAGMDEGDFAERSKSGRVDSEETSLRVSRPGNWKERQPQKSGTVELGTRIEAAL